MGKERSGRRWAGGRKEVVYKEEGLGLVEIGGLREGGQVSEKVLWKTERRL